MAQLKNNAHQAALSQRILSRYKEEFAVAVNQGAYALALSIKKKINSLKVRMTAPNHRRQA